MLLVGVVHRRRDVDVEAVGADHVAGVVEDLVADDYDVVNLTSGVDDAVPGAERTGGPPDLLQRGRDLAVVVGMLVRQHQVGGRVHGAGVVAVHPLDLGRPLPALIGEREPEPTDALGLTARQCTLDRRLPLEIGQLIRHVVQVNPANNNAASKLIEPFVMGTNRSRRTSRRRQKGGGS